MRAHFWGDSTEAILFEDAYDMYSRLSHVVAVASCIAEVVVIVGSAVALVTASAVGRWVHVCGIAIFIHGLPVHDKTRVSLWSLKGLVIIIAINKTKQHLTL